MTAYCTCEEPVIDTEKPGSIVQRYGTHEPIGHFENCQTCGKPVKSAPRES